MTQHRFIGRYDLSRDEVFITGPEQVKQITKVLRLKKGQTLVLCDGAGEEAMVEIVAINPRSVETRAITRQQLPEIKPVVLLFSAILKKENFDLVVQKSTELGVAKIIPIITERTVKQKINYERLARIAQEAAEQSGRGWLTQIGEAVDLVTALKDSRQIEARYFCQVDLLSSSTKEKRFNEVAVFVGPEGGWSEAEERLAIDDGCEPISLGSTILRAETAAIVGVYEVRRRGNY